MPEICTYCFFLKKYLKITFISTKMLKICAHQPFNKPGKLWEELCIILHILTRRHKISSLKKFSFIPEIYLRIYLR